jgi:hypothetical protein
VGVEHCKGAYACVLEHSMGWKLVYSGEGLGAGGADGPGPLGSDVACCHTKISQPGTSYRK